jgi:hypothetical protein
VSLYFVFILASRKILSTNFEFSAYFELITPHLETKFTCTKYSGTPSYYTCRVTTGKDEYRFNAKSSFLAIVVFDLV